MQYLLHVKPNATPRLILGGEYAESVTGVPVVEFQAVSGEKCITFKSRRGAVGWMRRHGIACFDEIRVRRMAVVT